MKKIPVTISPTFWILACLIAWVSSASLGQFVAWVAVVLTSVLVHEFGHALFATLWGQSVQIVLGPLGGTTIYGGGKKALSRVKEFIVVLSGPTFGLILALISFAFLKLLHPMNIVGYFLYWLMFANIIWSLFNLLPVHPFDGGKLMSIIFEGLFGLQGMRASYLLSGIFAVVLTALCMIKGYIFAGALLLLCAFESFKSFKDRRYFLTTASEKKIEELDAIEKEWNENQPELAIEHLQDYIKKVDEGEVHSLAVFRLAEYLHATGQVQRSYALLHAHKKEDADSLELLQLLCYKQSLWQEGLEVGTKLFRETQGPSAAILNAFCASHLGDVQGALNWLTTLKKSQAVDMKALVNAPDFDALRQDPAFRDFVSPK